MVHEEKRPARPARNVGFDGLRTIGLLAIILAHVGPPGILFQLRNFDVPLMVLVSGAVYGLSSGMRRNYFSYVGGRVMRVLAPTWIFLTIFFLFFPFSKETIIRTYTLLDGIGYVWIIRVFILVALIMPLFIGLYTRITNKQIYLLLLLLLYAGYECLYLLSSSVPLLKSIPIIHFILQDIIFYLLPFGCIAGLGLYMTKASRKSLAYLLAGFSVLFVGLLFVYDPNHLLSTQAYKYPPRIYYLSYALAVSFALYFMSRTAWFEKIFSTKIMAFLASSTLWIYLWHIFFLFQWKALQASLNLSFGNFGAEYLFVIICAVLVTYLQKNLIKQLVKKVKHKTLREAIVVSFLK